MSVAVYPSIDAVPASALAPGALFAVPAGGGFFEVFECRAGARAVGLSGGLVDLVSLGLTTGAQLYAANAAGKAQEKEAGRAFEAAARQTVAAFDQIQTAARAGQLQESPAAAAAAEALRQLAQFGGAGVEYVARKWAEYEPQFRARIARIAAEARQASAAARGPAGEPTPATSAPATSAPDATIFGVSPVTAVAAVAALLVLKKVLGL